MISLFIAKKGLFINGFKSLIISNCAKATHTTLIDSFLMFIFGGVLGMSSMILLSELMNYIKKRFYNKSVDKLEEKEQKVEDDLLEKNRKLKKSIIFLKICCAIMLTIWV